MSGPAELPAILAFVREQRRHVLTFIGYSGAGYEDPQAMLDHTEQELARHDPAHTLVNAGATAEGIGAVYALAQQLGFVTMGIVSTQAQVDAVALAAGVDRVFFVTDDSWGGKLEGSDELSPTSQAMVQASDAFVAIGGGEIGRDELLAARAAGKPLRFIPADMNHRAAIEKARKKGQPVPTEFRGAVHAAFA